MCFSRIKKPVLSFLTGMLALVICFNSGFQVKALTHEMQLIGVTDADGYNRFKFADKIMSDRLSLAPSGRYLNNYLHSTRHYELLYDLWQSDGIMIHTHGSKTTVKCTDSSGNVTYVTTASINNYANAFQTNFVVYGTCNAGEGGSSATNIVNATANKGAAVVIGFTGKTYVDQMNQYLYDFYKSLANGNTFSQAMTDGLYWAKFWNFGNAGGTNSPYTRGNLSKTPDNLV